MKRRELLNATFSTGLLSSVIPWQLAFASSEPMRYVFDACGFPGGDDARISDNAIASLRTSGYRMLQTTVGVVGNVKNAFADSIQDIEKLKSEIALHQKQVQLILSSADMSESEKAGKIGFILGFQDTTPLQGEIDNLRKFYESGLRCVQLTYNLENEAGSGCLVRNDSGIKKFGYEIIDFLKQNKMMLDLSHCSIKTTQQAIDYADYPVAITHSGCTQVFSHPRNKSDKILNAMADKGGVVGIYFMPYLCAAGTAKASDLIAHIEHAVNLCGEDHVGIGTDNSVDPTEMTDEYRKKFAEITSKRVELGIAAPREDQDSHLFIEDLNSLTRFNDLAMLLEKRGHVPSRIDKILGGNFRRLFADTLG